MSNEFGFEVENEQNSILITSKNRPLVYSYRGQISVTNGSVVDRPAVGSASFREPIRTPGPPRIFVRLASSRHASMTCYIYLTGSSGNWTGFTIVAASQGGGTLPLYVLDYVICQPSGGNPPEGEWGFALFDETGNPLFNNTERLVKFGKFTKRWTYSRSSNSQRVQFHTFDSNVAIDIDDFIDITYFNRGTIFQHSPEMMYTSLVLYSGSRRVLRLQTQDSTDLVVIQGTGSLNHCMAICKFPIDVYP